MTELCRRRSRAQLMRVVSCLFLLACAHAALADAKSVPAANVPRPDHVIVVIFENRAFDKIIGKPAAPYVNAFAGKGALFTQSYGIAHPSQPNYLALFSGSTHGVTDNKCRDVSGDNLASELIGKGLSFKTYSESMPWRGYRSCKWRAYQRKHNPVASWPELGSTWSVNMAFSSFPENLAELPTVSFVVPDQKHDMHDDVSEEGIRTGDQWLAKNLDPFVQWAATNNSLLIVTWDEDDGSSKNRIATLFVGPMVKPGNYATRINHYSVLRTILDMYGLRAIGETAKYRPIMDVWTPDSLAGKAAK